MKINAYAKINLTLDITGTRADGYHLLRMVMQSVSLHDTITIDKTEGPVAVYCVREDVPCDASNTAAKAAQAFFASVNQPNAGVRIQIEKQIPSQAGLGGGSADAAAVLHALNQMYGTRLSLQQLCEIGLTVGADVPFCVRGGTLLAEGIGEQLSAVPLMPDCVLVIVKPQIGVNTKEAFALADAALVPQKDSSAVMLKALESGSLSAVSGALSNAFAEILQIPQVEELRRKLCESGALNACMTGSGSAVFGIFDDEVAAKACVESLKREYPDTYLCKPISTVI